MDNVSRRLDKRIALVTGAASGIGRAIATRFVAEGARVALVDRNSDVLTEVQEALGTACITVVADVSVEANIAWAVSRTVEAFGRLDIAVNSAGVGDGNLIMLMEEEQWERVHGTCLKGVFLSMKHEARQMAAQGDGGVVINISSLNSQQPAVGVGAYCAAKAGVNMLTQVGAMELGPAKIRVCGIAPGLIATPMSAFVIGIPEVKEAYLENIPLGRMGIPADIAGAAVFLASDDAAWISGTTLFVDGASLTMRYPDVAKILANSRI